MSNVKGTFDTLCDLMLHDQFFHVCNRDLRLFLKERIPESAQEMSGLADQFREARVVSAVSLSIRNKADVHSQGSSQVRATVAPQKAADGRQQGDQSFNPRGERHCYKCGKHGHIARDCPTSISDSRSPRVNNVMSDRRKRHGPNE